MRAKTTTHNIARDLWKSSVKTDLPVVIVAQDVRSPPVMKHRSGLHQAQKLSS